MLNQKRGNIAMAHDSNSRALNTVINVHSCHLRSSLEVLWWGFVGVQISVLSDLVLFTVVLLSKDNFYIRGKCGRYPKQCN
jgi:hypothetical protein